MKKVLIGLSGILAAVIILAVIWGVIRYQYEPPQIVGDALKSSETDLEALSREWFQTYAEKLKGWRVPSGYRIREAKITGTELLTDTLDSALGLPETYVQIDYIVYPSSSDEKLAANLELAATEDSHIYQGQMVLKWSQKAEDEWVIEEKLSPVQYQLRTEAFLKSTQEPQTEHYKMVQGEASTYFIENEKLYVTYDSGETFEEVPDGYEAVCGTSNGTYDEFLPENSYVIRPEFTAFVGNTDSVVLLYSTDAGKTWQESSISRGWNIGNTFVSKTDTRCYVTMGVDKSLGNEYYATYYTEDFQRWEQLTMPDVVWSNLTCSYWPADGSGYYAKGGALYVTKDYGATFEEAEILEAEEQTAELGYNPFDSVEKIYQEDGITYLIVGQGDDGDYAREGKLVKALYQSQDGVQFTFVEERLDETPEQAG